MENTTFKFKCLYEPKKWVKQSVKPESEPGEGL